MSSSRGHRTVLSLAFASVLVVASAVPLHAQDDSQPTGPTPPDVQQLIDQATQQAQNGQVPTAAPGNPLPDEPTIAQLREELERAMHVERQRELLGDQAHGDNLDPHVAALQLELLDRTYKEDIQPVFQNATTDCLVAELGFTKGSDWAHQVEELGLASTPEDTQDVGVDVQDAAPGTYGPLYGELAEMKTLTLQILHNCDKEVYDECLRDDGDPNAPFLGVFTRQLAYLEDNEVYQQRYLKCETGWHGTLTIHEEMAGASRSRQAFSNGTATTVQWDTSGTRDFSVERPNKKQGTTGTAKGHSLSTDKTITTDPRCTTTQTMTREITGEGSGDASLRLLISGTDGSYALGFTGPDEPGAAEHDTTSTQSNCGGPQPPQTLNAIGQTAPYRGTITDKLSDPLAETISGTRSMSFIINGSGALTLAQETSGGALIRIPAVPGGARVQSEIMPWLSTTPPSNVDQSNYPTVRVTITWHLAFGTQ